MSDPKRPINPRFAAVAEELAPPPPPKPIVSAAAVVNGNQRMPRPNARMVPPLGQAAAAILGMAGGYELEAIARTVNLQRNGIEDDASFRARVEAMFARQVMSDPFDPTRDYAAERVTPMRRVRSGGALAIEFEGILFEKKTDRWAGRSREEVYVGWDGNAQIEITIARDERIESVFGDADSRGRIKGGF